MAARSCHGSEWSKPSSWIYDAIPLESKDSFRFNIIACKWILPVWIFLKTFSISTRKESKNYEVVWLTRKGLSLGMGLKELSVLQLSTKFVSWWIFFIRHDFLCIKLSQQTHSIVSSCLSLLMHTTPGSYSRSVVSSVKIHFPVESADSVT